MTIAYREYEAIGGRIFLPTLLGLAGQTPLPEWAFGTVAAGDAESEFVYLQFAPTVAVTLNQGDALVWDNSYMVVQAGTGTGFHPFGADLGAFFLGGRLGDPAVSQGSFWSYTFQPGVYGIWVQRAGTSLINMASITAQTRGVVSQGLEIMQLRFMGYLLGRVWRVDGNRDDWTATHKK